MTRGRMPSGSYKNCIPTMIPIPKELHKALKIYCVEEGKTMKSVFYELTNTAIKELLGGK